VSQGLKPVWEIPGLLGWCRRAGALDGLGGLSSTVLVDERVRRFSTRSIRRAVPRRSSSQLHPSSRLDTSDELIQKEAAGWQLSFLLN